MPFTQQPHVVSHGRPRFRSTGAPWAAAARWSLAALLPAVFATAAAAQPPASPSPMPQAVSDSQPGQGTVPPYRLQVSDRMELKFFYAPQLNETVKVRPDGRLSLQLIGEIQAAGRTVADFEGELEQRYGSSLQKPDVAVVMQDFAPPRVYVGGEVRSPGTIELRGPMTTFQSIMNAGGFTHDAKPETVVVLRYQDSANPTFIRLDLKPTSKKRTLADIEIQPFDVIYVPRSRIATVADFFGRYIGNIVPLYRNMGINAWYDLNGNNIVLKGQ